MSYKTAGRFISGAGQTSAEVGPARQIDVSIEGGSGWSGTIKLQRLVTDYDGTTTDWRTIETFTGDTETTIQISGGRYPCRLYADISGSVSYMLEAGAVESGGRTAGEGSGSLSAIAKSTEATADSVALLTDIRDTMDQLLIAMRAIQLILVEAYESPSSPNQYEAAMERLTN